MKSEMAKRCVYSMIKGINDLACISVGALMGFCVGAVWLSCQTTKKEDESKGKEQKPEDEA